MKVALCLHGYFDSLTDNKSLGEDGYEHLVKRVHEELAVKPDVYIHSWEPHLREKICNLYDPVAFSFEPQIDFSSIIEARGLQDIVDKSPRPPQSVISHFYSIQKVFNLCYMNNNDYDIIIKARFDTGRINRNPNRTPVQCITFNPNIKPARIYMADWEMFDQGPADMWFYGDKNIMQPFTTIWSELIGVFYKDSDFHNYAKKISNNEGDLSNSVVFYKWWMEMKGLWERKIPLECTYE